MPLRPAAAAEGSNAASNQQQLREVLGVSAAVAAALLRDAGSMEGAIALHFAQRAGPSAAAAQPAGPVAAAARLRAHIIELGLGEVSLAAAGALLRRAGGSLDAAVGLHLADAAAGSGGAAAAGPINVASTSDDGSEEGEEEEDDEGAGAPPGHHPHHHYIQPGGHLYHLMAPDGEGSSDEGISSGDEDGLPSDLSSNDSDSSDEEPPEFLEALRALHAAAGVTPLGAAAGAPALGLAPVLDAALSRAARAAPPPGAVRAPLPLAALRRGGRLCCADAVRVPASEAGAPLAGAVPLGALLLPLDALNAGALAALRAKAASELVWGTQRAPGDRSRLAHAFAARSVQGTRLAAQGDPSHAHPHNADRAARVTLATGGRAGVLQELDALFPPAGAWQRALPELCLARASASVTVAPADLLLEAGRRIRSSQLVATARAGSENDWVAAVLRAMCALEGHGAAELHFTLVRRGADGAPADSGAGAGAGAGPSAAPAAGGKGKGKGKAKPAAGKGSAAAAAAPPTHIRAALTLTPEGLTRLAAPGEAAAAARRAGGPAAGLCDALAAWIAAALAHGEGIAVGPDCDGVLNFGDTPAAELAAADALAAGDAAVRAAALSVEALLAAGAPAAAAPAPAPRPAGLLTAPKRYQLAGLRWMLDRERLGDAVGRGAALLHPAWAQLLVDEEPPPGAAAGAPPPQRMLYLSRLRPHALSSTFLSAPSTGTCGGILADAMGVGKSLQALMLALAHRPPAGWAAKPGADADADADPDAPMPVKTTLLVAPAVLLSQWEREVRTHLAPGALSWGRLLPTGAAAAAAAKGKGKAAAVAAAAAAADVDEAPRARRRVVRYAPDASPPPPAAAAAPRPTPPPLLAATPGGGVAEVGALDLCLVSYEALRDQLHARGEPPLCRLGFWRVVLDEAQLIANSSSSAAVMASALWRRHAWVISGTPVTARLDEVRGLLEFLAAEPFHRPETWRRLVRAGADVGALRLRALLRGVMLRRRRADVAAELALPPCAREDLVVELSPVERLVFEAARREFLEAARALGRGGGAAGAPAAGGRAAAAFTALRQAACHPALARRAAGGGGAGAAAGAPRASFREIMARLVAKAYAEWDAAARRVLDARVLAAAVGARHAPDPAAALAPAVAALELNRRAAALADGAGAAERVRGILGAVNEAALAEAEAAAAGEREAARKGKRARAPDAAGGGEGGGAGGGGDGDAAAKELARGRERSWMKLELDARVLLAFVLREALARRPAALAGAPAPAPPPRARKRALGAPPAAPSPAAAPAASLAAALGAALAEAAGLREALGAEAGAAGALLEGAGDVRRSRRAAGIDAASAAEVDIDFAEVREQLEDAVPCVREFKELRARKDPAKGAAARVAAAEREAAAAWHRLAHVLGQRGAAAAAAAGEGGAAAAEALLAGGGAGAGAAGAGPSNAGAAAAAAAPSDESCIVCFDLLSETGRAVAPCGHSAFCGACIRACMADRRTGICPICRAPFAEADLVDAASEVELAAERAAAAAAAAGAGGAPEYGAKVAALLADFTEARARDPSAKAVVFSSWNRLLRLVGDALAGAGLGVAALGGAAGPAAREAAVRRFRDDDDCAVLTVLLSHSGGASGLTLTCATVAYLMEPSLNPGLEAQAGARICRLGQARETRVVRLLAARSADALVVEMAARKLARGGRGGAGRGGGGGRGGADRGRGVRGDEAAAAAAAEAGGGGAAAEAPDAGALLWAAERLAAAP
jgi:E3 ubiquitin-protein ligase SHPRH